MTARGRPSIHSREDDLLAHLYRDVTEQQAARFSAEYDLPAGQGRYAGWLREQVTGAEIWDADRAVTVLYSQHYRALVGAGCVPGARRGRCRGTRTGLVRGRALGLAQAARPRPGRLFPPEIGHPGFPRTAV